MMPFANYLGVGLAGTIFALILIAMGISGFWGTFLSAFLAFPLGGTIRSTAGKFFAHETGYTGKQPYAFSLPIRLAIGAAVAAGIAYLFSMSDFYRFSAFLGGTAGLITGLITSVIFYLKISFSK